MNPREDDLVLMLPPPSPSSLLSVFAPAPHAALLLVHCPFCESMDQLAK